MHWLLPRSLQAETLPEVRGLLAARLVAAPRWVVVLCAWTVVVGDYLDRARIIVSTVVRAPGDAVNRN